MRKAGKKRIAAAMAEYLEWREELDKRIALIEDVPGAAEALSEQADDVRQRIEDGDLGPFTYALAKNIQRQLRWTLEGDYSKVEKFHNSYCWTRRQHETV